MVAPDHIVVLFWQTGMSLMLPLQLREEQRLTNTNAYNALIGAPLGVGL